MSNFIVGVDEVGRGSLVGSVIICAFRSRDDLFELLPFSVKDSKKINKKQREEIHSGDRYSPRKSRRRRA